MAKVYWTDFRTTLTENLQQKLTRLLTAAGMGDIDFDKKFAAIKIHFGEPGNLAYLRPNWAKTVVEFIARRQAVFDRLQHALRGRAQKRARSS